MHDSRCRKAGLLGTWLLLAASSLPGCSGASLDLDDPGVSLPEKPPERTFSDEVIAINNSAANVMFSDEDEALRLFDQAITLDPNYYMAYTNKATLLIYQEKYAEAIPCFENASQLRPHLAECYIGWAYCLHATGNKAESKRRLRFAIAAYNKRLKSNPNDPWTLANRALAASLFGETDLAQQELDRILESDPSFMTAQHLKEAMEDSNGKDDLWEILFD